MSQEENLHPVKFTLKSGATINAFVNLSAEELMDDPNCEKIINKMLNHEGFYKTVDGCVLIVGTEIAAFEWGKKHDTAL